MGDWDFLHEMNDEGYSENDIEEAMSSGASPKQWDMIQHKNNKRTKSVKIKSKSEKGSSSRNGGK